jgi:PAS domain-containing protein
VSDHDTNDLETTLGTGGREGDLRGIHQRFERALEHAAAIGMALVSPEGRWLKANGALCHLVGYKEEELLA